MVVTAQVLTDQGRGREDIQQVIICLPHKDLSIFPPLLALPTLLDPLWVLLPLLPLSVLLPLLSLWVLLPLLSLWVLLPLLSLWVLLILLPLWVLLILPPISVPIIYFPLSVLLIMLTNFFFIIRPSFTLSKFAFS